MVSCGVGQRHSSDPALLWLWCRPAAAAQIQPPAWEPPYAEGVALKTHTQKKEEEEKQDLALTTIELSCVALSFLL